MINLLKALFVAVKAHRGQRDKGGNPYVLHPIRVSLKAKSLDGKIVALLHDTVEDTDISLDDLEFLSLFQSEALQLLTHDKDTPYMEYIENIKSNKLATEVKLCDLEDNMNLNRLKTVTDSDIRRKQKYERAFTYLQA